uniref:Uncharacterized protein n=1 Tax=Strigamia maritima TaxID=126957 RepID=T1ITK9_STRMM
MLLFVKSNLWKTLFGKEADRLEHANDDERTSRVNYGGLQPCKVTAHWHKRTVFMIKFEDLVITSWIWKFCLVIEKMPDILVQRKDLLVVSIDIALVLLPWLQWFYQLTLRVIDGKNQDTRSKCDHLNSMQDSLRFHELDIRMHYTCAVCIKIRTCALFCNLKRARHPSCFSSARCIYSSNKK